MIYLIYVSIYYWANYTQGKTKLSRKSENAVADDRVFKFLYGADLRHVESSVRCHRKYKNGLIKVDLGYIIFIYLHALFANPVYLQRIRVKCAHKGQWVKDKAIKANMVQKTYPTI